MSEIKKHEEKCSTCEEKQACVPFFLHENAMMHKDMDNERMAGVVKEFSHVARGQRILNIVQMILTLLIVLILVSHYTARMKVFNDTITQLNHTIVELKDRTIPRTEVEYAKNKSTS